MILVDCVCGGRLALTLRHRVLCLAQVRGKDQGDRGGAGTVLERAVIHPCLRCTCRDRSFHDQRVFSAHIYIDFVSFRKTDSFILFYYLGNF